MKKELRQTEQKCMWLRRKRAQQRQLSPNTGTDEALLLWQLAKEDEVDAR